MTIRAPALEPVRDLHHDQARLIHHCALWAVIALVLSFSWTGFMASDDSYYVMSGLGWAYEFPYVAEYFAQGRAIVGIAMAPFIRLFGERELVVVLSTMLFFAGTMSVTLHGLSRVMGPIAATAVCASLSTLPLFALKATIPGADLPTLFFVASSLWLFWRAGRSDRRGWILSCAGACAALAFSAHETGSGLIVCYGVLFLAGFGIRRREYWIMAIGFLAIIAVEAIYYGIVAGNPLHRFSLIIAAAQGGGDRVALDFLARDAGGSLHVSAYLDPLVMFFTRHEFGIVGVAAAFAVWWACVSKRRDRSTPLVLARMLAAIALVWSIYAAIQLRTVLVLPRYYIVPAYCLAVVVALWAYFEVWPKRPRVAVAGVAALVMVNLAAIYVDNKNPMFGVRALVAYLAESSGPVHTDPLTANNASWFCRWARTDCSRLEVDAPQPGDVFFYNPRYADSSNRFVLPDQVRLYRPQGDWPQVWHKEESRKASGALLELTGLDRWLPAGLTTKLDRPNPSVAVYEVPR